MKHALSINQVARYEDLGYLSPLPVFSAREVQSLRDQFERFERHHGASSAGLRTDLHLLERWAWDVVTDRRVVDRVVSLLGENVLLWSMNWFIKDAGDGKFVSLHQDANYWGLEPHDVVTAWIALSDASPDTGPMAFLPGSHRGALYDHENTYAENNLLSRGQVSVAQVSNEETSLAPLAAGEMSLHHVRLLHGSGPNVSQDRRIGMVLRYCGTQVRQTKGSDTAVLVNGVDSYGHFELLAKPKVDNGARERKVHLDAVERMGKIIMAD
ncbi:MAG: phytanoyl-CoA dioxygenase family protein [Pseudomonadales bacterium]|nr:phytanoyl-CoA dioxygenase family protein [Pseudomonadales bacterium]